MQSGVNGNDMAQQGIDNAQAQVNQTTPDAAQAQVDATANPYYQQAQTTVAANPYYQPTAIPVNPALAPQPSMSDMILGTTTNERFIRGLIIGAAATYLLTNEKAQKAVVKTGMKVFGAVAGGVEEFKEKIMDAKAELEEEAMQPEEGAQD